MALTPTLDNKPPPGPVACLAPPYSNVIMSAPSRCPHPPLMLWLVSHMDAHVHARACVALT